MEDGFLFFRRDLIVASDGIQIENDFMFSKKQEHLLNTIFLSIPT